MNSVTQEQKGRLVDYVISELSKSQELEDNYKYIFYDETVETLHVMFYRQPYYTLPVTLNLLLHISKVTFRPCGWTQKVSVKVIRGCCPEWWA